MNMRQSIQLSIPAACRQSWSGMQMLKDGRYCDACQKTVVDFTAMTDGEVIKYFHQTTTAACGRFTSEQLNRNLSLPRKPLPFLKYLVFISLPAFLLSFKTGAFVRPTSTEMTPLRPDQLKKVSHSARSVEGEVRNGMGAAEPGVKVLVVGTTQTTITDTTGKFLLRGVRSSDTVLFQFPEHFDLKRTVASIQKNDVIQLESTHVLMGEVIVTPWPRKRTQKKKWFWSN